MAERPGISNDATHFGGSGHKYFVVLLAAVMLLVVTAVATIGEVTSKDITARQETEIDYDTAPEGDQPKGDVESVTISIDLKDGGAIDLQTADGDVTIDTYDGDEVLLVVEKLPLSGPRARPAKPVSIQVTRVGKDVRIAASEYATERMRGFDISYTLMVPRSTALHYNYSKPDYDFTKLTGVLLRVLSREALNWIIR